SGTPSRNPGHGCPPTSTPRPRRSPRRTAASAGCVHLAACMTGPPAGPRASGRPSHRWPPTAARCIAAGCGVPRPKFAERPRRCRPRTAATSGGFGSVQQTPVNGATNQRFSVNRGEDEHRDLPVRLRLVLRVVRPGGDRTLPPDGLLVAEYLARLVI